MANKTGLLKFVTVIAGILVLQSVEAKPAALWVVAGHPNELRHVNVSNLMSQTFASAYPSATRVLSRGPVDSEDTFAGQWQENSYASTTQFSSAEDFTTDLKAVAAQVQSQPASDSLIVFVNDHGRAPRPTGKADGSVDPQTAGISLLRPLRAVRQSDVLQSLQTTLPADRKVKLIGVQCFAGGMHTISWGRENTCSLSATNFRLPHLPSRGIPQIALYAKGISDEIQNRRFDLDHDGKTSLMEAHMAGTLMDSENSGLAETSSMSFVDNALHEGAFAPVWSEDNVHGLRSRTQSTASTRPTAAGPSHGTTAKTFEAPLLDDDADAKLDDLLLDDKSIAALPPSLRKFYATLVARPDIKSRIADADRKDPAYLQEKARIASVFAQKTAELDALKLELSSLNRKIDAHNTAKKANDVEFTGLMNRQKQILDQLRAIQAEANKADAVLSPTRAFEDSFKAFLRKMRRVGRFEQSATPEQLKTYQRLLACEMEAI